MPAESKTLARIAELLSAIDLLCREGKIVPALLLIYSTIDILSSLVRKNSDQDTKKTDFIDWVQTYMLPHPDIQISAVDLYAARCGMLHALSPTSNLSRGQAAKEIAYACDAQTASEARRTLTARGKDGKVAVVSIPAIIECFLLAGEKFTRALGSDASLQQRFFANEKHVFRVE